jgi:serine phosphatase RsbU (regulator of sigma subunit)/anti-sigma regulatory factor (Ser/Thr protein kinase)
MVADNQLIACLTYRENAQCELSPDLALVPEVAGRIRAYCFRHGLDPQTWAAVELALVEGLNNAIEHGCRGLSEGSVRVRWTWEEEMLTIEILDPGHFQPGPVPVRLPDPLSERGRGTFVMSTLMDRVSHEVAEGSHLLILQKRLGPPAEFGAGTEATLAGMIGELSSSYESITALFRFGEELATARSFDDFVEKVLQRLLKLVSGDEAWLRLDGGGDGLKLVSLVRVPYSRAMPEFLRAENDSVEMQVFAESEQHTAEDCSALGAHDPLRRERGSAFVCPISFREATIGVLSVVRAQTHPYFTAGETRLIGVVADFFGIARTMALSQEQLQEQQRTERELEIAAEIQQSLLPRTFPETGKVRIFGLSQTAHEVGGDYFDLLPMGHKGVLLAIADVMGKGMPAALLAMILRTTIRAHSELAGDPGRLLTIVNRQLSGDLNNLGMFITAQLAFISYETDELIFASAGHCPMLKLSPGATCAGQRRGEGVPLGVLEEVEYETMREPIAPGDRFIFLTDGIFEAESVAGGMLGLDVLAQQLPVLCVGDPQDSCRRLLDYVASYSAGTPATDDRTLLIVQRV